MHIEIPSLFFFFCIIFFDFFFFFFSRVVVVFSFLAQIDIALISIYSSETGTDTLSVISSHSHPMDIVTHTTSTIQHINSERERENITQSRATIENFHDLSLVNVAVVVVVVVVVDILFGWSSCYTGADLPWCARCCIKTGTVVIVFVRMNLDEIVFLVLSRFSIHFTCFVRSVLDKFIYGCDSESGIRARIHIHTHRIFYVYIYISTYIEIISLVLLLLLLFLFFFCFCDEIEFSFSITYC